MRPSLLNFLKNIIDFMDGHLTLNFPDRKEAIDMRIADFDSEFSLRNYRNVLALVAVQ